MSLLPAAFLFRPTIPIRKISALPRSRPPLLKLPETCRVPFPAELSGQQQFSELRMAWNERGVAVSCSVAKEPQRQRAAVLRGEEFDGFRLWFDLRDTRANHRASRFCCHFVIGTTGGDPDGMGPKIWQVPVARAAEDAPEVELSQILLEGGVTSSGWQVAAWFPAEVLPGYDPLGLGRLGFYCHVRDRALGHNYFVVGEDFPFPADPALWVSLELSSDDDS